MPVIPFRHQIRVACDQQSGRCSDDCRNQLTAIGYHYGSCINSVFNSSYFHSFDYKLLPLFSYALWTSCGVLIPMPIIVTTTTSAQVVPTTQIVITTADVPVESTTTDSEDIYSDHYWNGKRWDNYSRRWSRSTSGSRRRWGGGETTIDELCYWCTTYKLSKTSEVCCAVYVDYGCYNNIVSFNFAELILAHSYIMYHTCAVLIIVP